MKKAFLLITMYIVGFSLFASAEIDLFTALMEQDWLGAEKILDRYPRLLEKQGEEELDVDIMGKTPLTFTLEYGMDHMTVCLLDYGAATETVDSMGWTPLMVAAYLGNVNMVEELLQRGAEVEVFESQGLSPLALAVGACRFEAADLLLEKGANLYGPIPEAEPIVQSIYESKINLREGLRILDVGAPAYPLFSGIEKGEFSFVRTVLLQGMNPNLPDSQGVTPLMLAASLEEPYMTELLVDMGADLNVQSKEGLSSLAIALYLGRERNTEHLLKGGADVNSGRILTDSPLYYGLIGGEGRLVAELVNEGATVTRRDGEGRTALMYAAFLGDWLSVQSLLEGGARASALDKNDKGVIYYAMTGYLMTGGENYYTIIDRLIAEGAESREYLPMAGGDRKFYELLEARWRS
ncbi:MAG: ankyrin repeat domain-containing protein [Spirochaetales bacterium]|nr:ankyrin repeat domain-containing protein [Spirochaetales bacterium]